MHKKILYITAMLLLAACSAEKNYRGVPESTWQQLSAEQKQLIVDQAFEQEINQPQLKK